MTVVAFAPASTTQRATPTPPVMAGLDPAIHPRSGVQTTDADGRIAGARMAGSSPAMTGTLGAAPRLSPGNLRQWIKRRESPAARAIYAMAQAIRGARVPVIRPLHRTLYSAHLTIRHLLAETARITWWTPLFLSRIQSPAPGLRLGGGMPQILGPLRMRVGRDCRISGHSTLIGRAGTAEPTLIVGDNVDIGWQNTISVGTRVELGDNVRLASGCMLAGFPGHPLDPIARAAGAPDTEDQIGDIILERDVWLATGVMVMAGVRIGHGTVVAAGSIVTRDLPPMVLAAGAPARIVRSLEAAA